MGVADIILMELHNDERDLGLQHFPRLGVLVDPPHGLGTPCLDVTVLISCFTRPLRPNSRPKVSQMSPELTSWPYLKALFWKYAQAPWGPEGDLRSPEESEGPPSGREVPPVFHNFGHPNRSPVIKGDKLCLGSTNRRWHSDFPRGELAGTSQ